MDKIERRNLAEHQEKTCQYRQYTCEHCGHKHTHHAITGHYEQCTDYPLDCYNKCGVTNIKRKDMAAHRKSCSLQPLTCPYKYVGCTAKVKRKDMADHRHEKMEEHLLLLAKSHEKLARENRDLALEVDELIKSKPRKLR
jgi:TNF receptor-associated factor 3